MSGEHRVTVDGGTITAVPGVTAGTNFYTAAITDVPGVVAANNFLSVFNPIGSGKLITFYASIVIPWASAAQSVAVSLNIFRITAASAGSLQTPDKFFSASPTSIAEARISNPTVTTTGASLGGFPPAITAAAGGASPTGVSTPSGASFGCVPGEGLVMRTASGSTAQLWNLGFIWAEI